MIALKHFSSVRPVLDAPHQPRFDRVLLHVIKLLVVIFVRTNAVMERSCLPTKFRHFQDSRDASLPNGYPGVEWQWPFSGFSKKVQVIGHDNVSRDDPVDMTAPSRLQSGVDLGIC